MAPKKKDGAAKGKGRPTAAAIDASPPQRKKKGEDAECQTDPSGEEVEVQTEPLDLESRSSQTPIPEFRSRDSQTPVKEFADAGTAMERNLEEKAAQTVGIPARPDFFLEMLLQLTPNNFIQIPLQKKTISVCLQAGRVVVRTGGGYMELQKFLERTCEQSEYLDSVGLGRRPRLWSGNAQPRTPGRSLSPSKQMARQQAGTQDNGRPSTAPAAETQQPATPPEKLPKLALESVSK